MTAADMLIPAVVVAVGLANGFGRRFAGGLLSQWLGVDIGTGVARAVQSAIAAGSVAGLAWGAGLAPHMAWWVVPAVAAATFVGTTWGFPRYLWHPPFIRFRKPDGQNESVMEARNLIDTIGLAINGVIACGALALGAWALGMSPWWLVLAGVLRAPAWWAAAIACPDIRWMGFWKHVETPYPRWIPMPTALAEFYSGMALGGGLSLTIAGV